MKNTFAILLAILLITLKANSQNINLFFIRENIETATGNTQFITSDPSVMDNLKDTSDEDEDEELKDEDLKPSIPTNFGVDIETFVTPTSSFLRVPLRYTLGNASFSLSIPYFYHRAMQYSHGSVSTMGFGDVVVTGAYKISRENIFTQFMVNAKLPSGDANKQVDGYLVPLGNGSTDLFFGNVFIYRASSFSIFNNISYRYSGSIKRTAEIDYSSVPDIEHNEIIDYNIFNGNSFILNTAFRYNIGKSFMIIAGVGLISNTEGKMDVKHKWVNQTNFHQERIGISANQDFLFVDLNTGVSYSIMGFNILATVSTPLVTQRNENNTEDDRKISFYLKLSRKLF